MWQGNKDKKNGIIHIILSYCGIHLSVYNYIYQVTRECSDEGCYKNDNTYEQLLLHVRLDP